MTLFPNQPYATASQYSDDYFRLVAEAARSVDRSQIDRAAEILEAAILRGARVYGCGNGGSAAISNHLACDFIKGIANETPLRPKFQSLSEAIPLMTAISNDLSYEDVFSFQLNALAEPGDVLVAVSSSGSSPNIVKAMRWARDHGVASIALTGFTGGEAAALANVSLHVVASNYGLVEDVHQSLLHALAQYLRQRNLHDKSMLGQRKF